MTGHELLRKLRRLARHRGVELRHDPRHGKGSHGRLIFGDRQTALKDPKKEIAPGLLRKMLRDLNIDAGEIS